MHKFYKARARKWAVIVAVASAATFSAIGALNHNGASAAKYPAAAEAVLLLDGTQTAPPDGFNMQIDDNGFDTAGGNQTFTHMFCVQSTLQYRCGVGANDLIRVQGTLADADLSVTQANQLAWLLTHRVGYDDYETQVAIWCITNPAVNAPVGNSDALCQAAKDAAVPAAPTLALSVLGSPAANEGSDVHFSLSTNAPNVNLAVSDGGAGATLCGTSPDNASATINGSMLQQTLPAIQRTFELCLNRSNIASGTAAATLTASLDATTDNLQAWVHPTAPKSCQGLVDVAVDSQRLTASAQGSWTNVHGSLTITKKVIGDTATGNAFSVTVSGPNGFVATHDFPDTSGDPWSHTFSELVAGSYTVVETATGGATRVVVSPTDTSVVSADSDTAITITNSFVGKLRLTKQTDIPTGKTFGIDINCTYGDQNVNEWSNPIKLKADESFTSPELPNGTRCSVNEVDSGNPKSTLIQLDSLGVQTQVVGTQASGIVVSNNTTVGVNFFNSFGQGSTIPSTTSTASPTSIAATSTTLGKTVNSLGTTTTPDTDDDLARTGSDADELVLIASTAIVAGGALMLGTRRRNRNRRLR